MGPTLFTKSGKWPSFEKMVCEMLSKEPPFDQRLDIATWPLTNVFHQTN